MEVQWSAQSSADFTRRQERYTAAGVTCLWFVHRRNKEAAEAAKVPHFVFSDRESINRVKAREAFGAMLDVILEEVVRRALTGGYKRRIEVRERQLIIDYYEDTCSQCFKNSTIYRLHGVFVTTVCGKQGILKGGEFIPYPHVRIESQLATSIEKVLSNATAPLAPLRMRTSKRAGQNYLAYNCAHCRGFFSSFFIAQQHYYDWNETLAPDDAAVRLNVRSLDHEHLCDDIGNGNCRRTAEERPNYLCWWDPRGEVRTDSPDRVRVKAADVVEPKPADMLVSFEAVPPPPSFDEQVRLRFAELDGSSRPEHRTEPAPQAITVAEMTQEELRTALYNAYRALDDGYIRKKSDARQAAGMYDDLPELLGKDYPSL